jgi:8-oxo-dGTP pyrophosphatase MutT (NUDIX family)
VVHEIAPIFDWGDFSLWANMLRLTSVPGFEAHKVPVLATDAHLPALSPQSLTPTALQERFLNQRMLNESWQDEFESDRLSSKPKQRAAVLMGVITHVDEPRLLLTQRASNMRTHSSQVAFPGGKVDPSDKDMVETALREAQEEVGLDPKWVRVLGQLSEYETFANIVVTPVVALIDPGCQLSINPHEVARAFEVPLAFLMDPKHHQRHRLEHQGQSRSWYSIAPDFGVEGAFIWGATASMIRGLYQFLNTNESG